MEDIKGEIRTASGLASLFSTAVTWFDYVCVTKPVAKRLESLLLKLDNAQLRLTRWGEATGLTDRQITNDESLKTSSSYRLDEEQEARAIQTFQNLTTTFEEHQKLVLNEHTHTNDNGNDNTSVRQTEIEPFEQAIVNWDVMNLYLHKRMQEIVRGRRNAVLVPERVQFAIHQENQLQTLIKKVNDHIDQLWTIYLPPVHEEKDLGETELKKLLQVVKQLGFASASDPLINKAIQAFYEQKSDNMSFHMKDTTVQKQGRDDHGSYTMNAYRSREEAK